MGWQPPVKWRRRFIARSRAPVTVDHYIAGESEIIDLETTGTMFALYLKEPTTLELRTLGAGWAPKRFRTPLMYVPAGFSFSSRWSKENEWMTVHFDASWLARSGLETNGQFASGTPRFDLSDDLLMQIVRGIHEDALAGTPQGPMYAEALGAAALRRMAYLESRPRAREYTHAPMMRRAADYIQARFRDDLTVSMIAAAVDYPGDVYSFIRSFKKAIGVTPHRYIIESRLQAARNMIAQGQCDVTDAALSCGFSTASHFSATFRKRWGISPSELKPASTILTRAEERVSIGR
ncbi:putative transcriptional regulator, AraC family [Cupriavidus taiwanensis]|uniref:Transcriptional regulator, AraC family n=2 Tax=Cupriavidus taiwanensis TaxID=164546 RepID=A0A375CSS5_9BURK|nr:putative transcriptional regulator, AraC family [Cupriavidus taiwanensis]